MRLREDVQASLANLPSFALQYMAEANRALVAEARQRRAAGEPVAPMYDDDERLAYLELVAQVAEEPAGLDLVHAYGRSASRSTGNVSTFWPRSSWEPVWIACSWRGAASAFVVDENGTT